MSHYRIYLLNINGHIDKGVDAHCDADQDACALAQLMVNDSDSSQAEVWTGAKYIGKVPIPSISTAPS